MTDSDISPCISLLFQCQYVGTSVEALIVEVGLVPPPPPVAAFGPLRVELRLGNGFCTTKGCVEGKCEYHLLRSYSHLALTVLLTCFSA